MATNPGCLCVVRLVTLLQPTQLLVFMLQRIIPQSPLEKPIGELRERRLLRVKPTAKTPLFGPNVVKQIVTPAREL